MRMSYFPGDRGNGLRPAAGQHKEDGKPFRADVHAVHAVNQFGVICYLVRQHAQSASNGHFARLVEKIHMRFLCC